MSVMAIPSRLGDYTVAFAETAAFVPALERLAPRVYVVDETVWALYADTVLKPLQTETVIVQPAREALKNLAAVEALYDRLLELSAKRNLTLISIGGGIIQDITGFVVSTLYRGLHWVYVPTTLLAQADACIGGKTSLNYRHYKNLLGTFYPPAEIFVYTPFLATLSDLDFYSGLGEVIKLHLLGGAAQAQAATDRLPAWRKRDPAALRQGVQTALDIKRGYITDDEFDQGRRNLLNYGHCFGHALEAASDFAIPHGQAVVLGMWLANRVARRRGRLSAELEAHISDTLLRPGLVVRPPAAHFAPGPIVAAMEKDKKRTGAGLALIMLTEGYTPVSVKDLTPAEVRGALDEIFPLLMGEMYNGV